MHFICSSLHRVYCTSLKLFVRLHQIISANSIAGKFFVSPIGEKKLCGFICWSNNNHKLVVKAWSLLFLFQMLNFWQFPIRWIHLSGLKVGNVNMFWWSYCSSEERLEQLFLTRTVTHIMCCVKHQWDHLTGSSSNRKHVAEGPKHLQLQFHLALVAFRGRRTPVPTFSPTDR